MTTRVLQPVPARVLLVLAMGCALLMGVMAPPGRAQSTGTECAAPYPLADVGAGLTGTGLTVTRGTQPETFGAEVLGVLNDGIAPGVDMIVADLSSPAVAEAGVWAGMSGSPVYAADGRLIGAVSYSLAADPSSIAGITPAAQMTKLYDYAGSTREAAMDQQVQLPAGLRRRAAEASDATDAQLREGLSPIPVPVAVSGLGRSRLSELEDRLERKVDLALYAGARAEGTQASADDIFPGSNFAAAISYGDVTAAGIGTTTDVCDGMALAFGHPFNWDGRTAHSAHTADAIVIQPDSGLGISYKVANPGGIVGTVDQDRLTGIRGRFGDGPDATVVRSAVRSTTTGAQRTGRTSINLDRYVPDLAPFHVLANLDLVLDKIGAGRTQLTWTARGTYGNGTPWTLKRQNRFADRFDVSFESIFEMADWLFVMQDNRFTNVQFDRIDITSTVAEDHERLRLGTVEVKVNDGRWRRINAIQRLRPRPGDVIRTRAALVRYQQSAAFRRITQRFTVPRRLSGQSMRLGVFGGASLQGETNPYGGTSFGNILQRMRRQDSNNDVVMRLQRSGADGPRALRKVKRRIGNVVAGRRSVAVTVR